MHKKAFKKINLEAENLEIKKDLMMKIKKYFYKWGGQIKKRSFTEQDIFTRETLVLVNDTEVYN